MREKLENWLKRRPRDSRNDAPGLEMGYSDMEVLRYVRKILQSCGDAPKSRRGLIHRWSMGTPCMRGTFMERGALKVEAHRRRKFRLPWIPAWRVRLTVSRLGFDTVFSCVEHLLRPPGEKSE